VSYNIDNSSSKLKNALKRIAKIPYEPKFWREFERSYLLLARTEIDSRAPLNNVDGSIIQNKSNTKSNKVNLAEELCKRCLSYNKSCWKSWEILGDLMEKQQQYEKAVEFFEKCWNFQEREKNGLSHELDLFGKYSPSTIIMYKLIRNYFKAKQYVKAIHFCATLTNNLVSQDQKAKIKEIEKKCFNSIHP